MTPRDGLLPAGVDSPAGLSARLAEVRYLADEGLATAAYLGLRLHRPLFCEGEAGVGKTELAKALATVLGAPLIRLQCYEGIDASQALYDWDFPRQLLHLRTAEAAGAATGAALPGLEAELYDRRFLIARPLLAALETTPSVLLIDEVDRADDEFEAFLLEVLSDFQISIPEIGTIKAGSAPLVVLTSNRTRELHDALKRRCLYHWIGYPPAEREVQIVLIREPGVSEALARNVVAAVNRLRRLDLAKPPGVAETIDWARTVDLLGGTELDPQLAQDTLGAVVKERDDLDVVRDNLEEITSGA